MRVESEKVQAIVYSRKVAVAFFNWHFAGDGIRQTFRDGMAGIGVFGRAYDVIAAAGYSRITAYGVFRRNIEPDHNGRSITRSRVDYIRPE